MKTYSKVLVIHCHTTGINYGDDVTLNNQPLSIALGVVDMNTLKIIDSVNIKVQFNPEKYVWDRKLISIHGISLEEALDGMSFSDAASESAVFIDKHFDISQSIPVMGYNPLSFHVPFLNKVLKSEDIILKFDNRDIDLFPVMSLLGKYTIKEAFETFEIDQSEPLSSLYIIKSYVRIYKIIQSIMKEYFGE